MKILEFTKWLRTFINDKDALNCAETLELKDAISCIHNVKVFNITLTEGESNSMWKSTMTFPTPIFKNPYNYEITEVDKEYNKK